MKIIYLLKKGLQCYPPRLSQVLVLNDLSYDIEVFHGKNSSFIDKLLDDRGIVHHTFKADKDNNNRFESALNFISFSIEAKKIQTMLDPEALIWIGNMETAMSLNSRHLKNKSFALNVLELYDENTIYDRWLKKNVRHAKVIITCEKHRSAIMQSRYSLLTKPEVIPNKPYDICYENSLTDDDTVNLIKTHFTIVYQGMISKDRPLENIAKALSNLNDNRFLFLVMGACSDEYKVRLKRIYSNTVFTGYIPAPQHLYYTQYCKLGIANYDVSSLNNVFCAPNKIYEYSKFGIPMLCSTNMALYESIGENMAGCCVDFRIVDEIQHAIIRIYDDYNKYSANSNLFYNQIDLKEELKKIIDKWVNA